MPDFIAKAARNDRVVPQSDEYQCDNQAMDGDDFTTEQEGQLSNNNNNNR